MHEYRSGGWTAIVAEDGVALMDPGVSPEVARELWQLTSAGRRLGAWVEYLAGAGIAALPAFAMVEARDGHLRVLVRGDVEITTAERTVSGRGYTTWREEVLDAATEVTLTAAPTTGAWLPITGGIVAAGAIRFGPDGGAALVLDDEEDVELTVARMPALAAFTGATTEPADAAPIAHEVDAAPGTGVAGGETAGTDAGSGPVSSAVGADAGSGADASFAARAAAMFGPPPGAAGSTPPVASAVVPGSTGSQPAASEAAAADRAAPPDEDPDPVTHDAPTPHVVTSDAPLPALGQDEGDEDDAVESDEYDHLLWSTEQAKQHTPAAEPAPQPADESSAPAPAEPGPHLPVAQSPADGGADPEATQAPEPDPSDGWHTGGPAVASPAPAIVPEPATRPQLIDSVPGRSRPMPPPASTPGTSPASPASGGLPPAPIGRPVDLPRPSGVPEPYAQDDDDGDHDGETILAADLPSSDVPIAEDPVPAAIPEIELVLPHGPRVGLSRPVLLGRAPEASRFVGGEAPRLVSVPNPEKDVSGTHVEVRPAGSHVVVTDLNSTNGTVVTLPGQPAFRLQPGTGVPVPAGSVIELGVGVTVRVVLTGEEA